MEKKRIVFKIDKRLSDIFDEEAKEQHRSRSNLLELMIIKIIKRDYPDNPSLEEKMFDEEMSKQVII